MKIKFVILFTLVSFFSFAQNKNEISFGMGPSFFGWGDVTGAALSAGYVINLNNHFGFEPRFISSSGWRKENIAYNSGADYTYGYDYDQTGYLACAASLAYSPFNGKGNFLKLKSGFLAGTMVHTYGGKRFGGFPMEYSNFGKQVNLGLIHTVHFRILNREKLFLGTELSMLTSFSDGFYNCDGFVWNFMGGIKF
jgi:hypothetical protein